MSNSDDVPEIVRPEFGKGLFWTGVGMTSAYLAGMGIYAACVWPHILAMGPDGFATFLSGMFAPVAFLWLVLGFLQQGNELRNSADALWLQSEELRHSVTQQRDLVAVSREQLEAERNTAIAHEKRLRAESQPRLRLSYGGNHGDVSGSRFYSYSIANVGPFCTDVMLILPNELPRRTPRLDDRNKIEFNLELAAGQLAEDVAVIVTYLDMLGARGDHRFIVNAQPDGRFAGVTAEPVSTATAID